jgi:SOS response regulatory protein OraA/RecX
MSENQKAYLRALRLLSIKARFQNELECRLKQEEFSDQAIAYALERCANYFNDEELGKARMRSKAKKGFGARYLKANLRRYLSDEEAEDALEELDERAVLEAYLEKHPKLLMDPQGKARLLRRGFDLQSINEVFAKYRLPIL